MTKFILLLAAILYSAIGFSQNQNNIKEANTQSVLRKALAGETIKVVLDVSTYNDDNIKKFSNKLNNFTTEIPKVHYNKNVKKLTFIYNEHLVLNNLINIFNDNKISHKNSTIKLYRN